MDGEIADTFYPNLRGVLDPRFAALSDAELESSFESAFGEGVTPAEYEEFFGGIGKALGGVARDVGRFARQAAPVAQGALQGAAAGSALGPWGALGGALAGGVGSALQHHGRGSARDVGRVMSGVVGTAGMLTGRGGLAQGASGLLGMAGQLAGRRAPAAGQLLGLLQRPETSQALAALLGGRNLPIPVGRTGTPVPANAFAGLLGALAREAEAEAWTPDAAESIPPYLMDGEGGLVVDPSDPDQRAARLLQLLANEAEQEAWDQEAWDQEAEFEDVWEFEEDEDYIFELVELDEGFESDDAYDFSGV